MNRLHFVYCPQSGPNWIGEALPRDADSVHEIPMAVPAVVWANKSAHVYGTGLSWPGTRAGRAEMAQLLEALAVAAGGVAWDVRGQLCIVVPGYRAAEIAEAADSVMELLSHGLATTPEQRAYEIEGPEYWAARIRAMQRSPDPWTATCEITDRAGDVLEDGTQLPASRYTRITWQHPGSDPIEVGAPWEPSYLGGAKEAPEMYPPTESLSMVTHGLLLPLDSGYQLPGASSRLR